MDPATITTDENNAKILKKKKTSLYEYKLPAEKLGVNS
jgi:hypothetical protein